MVTFENCPLLWVSKIQTDIAISRLNSEFVTLYHSVRALLPLKIIIKELIDNLVIDSENLKFVSISTFYEDNTGAIVVEKIPNNYSYIKSHNCQVSLVQSARWKGICDL